MVKSSSENAKKLKDFRLFSTEEPDFLTLEGTKWQYTNGDRNEEGNAIINYIRQFLASRLQPIPV